MNPKLPYEDLLNEKLQRLPLPPVEGAWEDMKERLEREMPLDIPRSGRRRIWWRWTSLVLLLSAGLFFTVRTIKPRDGNLQESQQSVQNKNTPPADQNSTPLSSQNSQHKTSVSQNGEASASPAATVVASASDPGAQAPSANTPPASNPGAQIPSENKLAATTNAKEQPKFNSENLQRIFTNANPYPKDQMSEAGTRANETATTGEVQTKNRMLLINQDSEQRISDSKQLAGDSRKRLPVRNKFAPGDSTMQAALTKEGRRKVEKELDRRDRRTEREYKASQRSRQSFWGEVPERWFAAGLAPYQSFATGSQSAFNYNSGGRSNIATDYIPAAYLQFHLTDRIYVLSEFQFNSPQATSRLLLSSKRVSPGIGQSYLEEIYLRKTYYFNLPFSFYYSPIRNIYIGSGIQFSSFSSGLAYRERRTAGTNAMYSDVIKIKDDSLANVLRPSEFRYLFDANYYYKRFMFGFRYNQAFGSFINQPLFTGTRADERNQAFQLYFRYNLIESKR